MKKYVLAQPGEFDSTIKENLMAIKEAGYDGVFFTLEYKGLEDEHVSFARELGLDVETIHLPYSNRIINDLWDEEKSPEYAFKVILFGIDFAYRNHVNTVVLHTCNGSHPPKASEYGLKNYRYIAEYCKEKGIVLALENNKSFEHIEYALKGLSDLDNVKLCFDIGHANAFTKNLYLDVWDSLLNKLWCVHIHDNDGTRDSHLIPFMGTIDIVSWLKILREKKRDLNLTLEIYYMDRKEYYGEIVVKDFYTKSMVSIDRIIESLGDNL